MTTVFIQAQNSPFVTGIAANVSKTQGVDFISQKEFNEKVMLFALYYLALGVAMFVTSYVQV